MSPLQNRLQHIYHGQPYGRVELSPMPCRVILSPALKQLLYGALATSGIKKQGLQYSNFNLQSYGFTWQEGCMYSTILPTDGPIV